MKLVAYFTAKHGKQFLVSLTMREEKNNQFEFLRKSSTRYYYFMALIDEYVICLHPTPDFLRRNASDIEDRFVVM
jgi:splicing factor 3A subunit 1